MLRKNPQSAHRLQLRARTLVTLALCLAALSVQAQLEWETHTLRVDPTPNAESVSATFRFHNAGTTPIRIEQVRNTCGCTTAELEKKLYAPGETGELQATLTLEGREGLVQKAIYVISSDSDKRTDKLVIETEIPAYLKIEPSFAIWRDADNMTPQTLTLTVLEGYTIHLTDVQTSNDKLTADLRELEAGRRYALVLTPQVKEARDFTTVTIESDFPADDPMTFKTFGKILTRNMGGANETLWRRFLRWVSR